MSLRGVLYRWVLVMGLLVALPLAAWADAYSEGLAAYKGRNYARAAQYMQTALKQNPQNADAMFHLGMAYTHLNNLTTARQAFEMVIQMVPTSHTLAAKARNNINFITKQQITATSNSSRAAHILQTSLSRQSKENYLTHVLPNGKVVHFDRKRMPLRVFIASGSSVPGWNSGMRQAVTYAMRVWQAGTRGKVSFTQVTQEAGADIIVRWQRNFSDGILGVSPLQTVGNTIVRSDMNLAVYYPDSNEMIPMNDLQAIAVHELGHAIGVRGHSPYPEDIMYYSKMRHSPTLSTRDLNTIGMLYNLEADVQNHAGLSTAMTQKYYTLFEQGLQAQKANRPTEAIALYRQCLQISRQLPEAMFNLGAVLINEGAKMTRQNNLAGAKRNFEEASSLYIEVLRLPQAPSSARENLEIAQSNLASVNSALQGGQ